MTRTVKQPFVVVISEGPVSGADYYIEADPEDRLFSGQKLAEEAVRHARVTTLRQAPRTLTVAVYKMSVSEGKLCRQLFGTYPVTPPFGPMTPDEFHVEEAKLLEEFPAAIRGLLAAKAYDAGHGHGYEPVLEKLGTLAALARQLLNAERLTRTKEPPMRDGLMFMKYRSTGGWFYAEYRDGEKVREVGPLGSLEAASLHCHQTQDGGVAKPTLMAFDCVQDMALTMYRKMDDGPWFWRRRGGDEQGPYMTYPLLMVAVRAHTAEGVT